MSHRPARAPNSLPVRNPKRKPNSRIRATGDLRNTSKVCPCTFRWVRTTMRDPLKFHRKATCSIHRYRQEASSGPKESATFHRLMPHQPRALVAARDWQKKESGPDQRHPHRHELEDVKGPGEPGTKTIPNYDLRIDSKFRNCLRKFENSSKSICKILRNSASHFWKFTPPPSFLCALPQTLQSLF